jgi:hypothetical protein
MSGRGGLFTAIRNTKSLYRFTSSFDQTNPAVIGHYSYPLCGRRGDALSDLAIFQKDKNIGNRYNYPRISQFVWKVEKQKTLES